MKKNLILAAAAAIAASQFQMIEIASANKPGGREGKPGAVRAQEVREGKKAAETLARTGADSATIKTVMSEVKAARLDSRLTPNELTDLGRSMSANPEVLTAVKEAINQSKSDALRDLGQARIEGLARAKNIKTGVAADALALMSADARIEQAYTSLLIDAGKIAESWTPELRDNLTFLLQKTNELLATGRTVVEAMKEANEQLSKPKAEGGRSVRLNLDDVNKYCKKS